MKVKYNALLLLIAILSVSACNKKRDGSELNKAITWEYYSGVENYTDPKVKEALSSINVEDQCRVSIELLFPSIESNKYEAIRKDLSDFLLDRLIFENGVIPFDTTSDDPQGFVDNFVHYTITSFKDEIEEMTSEWYQENTQTPFNMLVKEFYLRDTLMYNDHGIVSIGQSNYSYFGGAHGLSLFTARNYDLKNSSPITPSTLFQDPQSSKILEAIEQQLLTDYDVSSIKELQEQTGIFSLTGSEIVIANEIFFSNEGITFYYNPYEIAPYAYGPTEVTVPYSVLAPYFMPQYQFLGRL